MQISQPGDIRRVGTDRGGNFACSVTGGQFVHTPRLFGHDSKFLFIRECGASVLSVRTHETAKETEARYGLSASDCGLSFNCRTIYSQSKDFLIKKFECLCTDRENFFRDAQIPDGDFLLSGL